MYTGPEWCGARGRNARISRTRVIRGRQCRPFLQRVICSSLPSLYNLINELLKCAKSIAKSERSGIQQRPRNRPLLQNQKNVHASAALARTCVTRPRSALRSCHERIEIKRADLLEPAEPSPSSAPDSVQRGQGCHRLQSLGLETAFSAKVLPGNKRSPPLQACGCALSRAALLGAFLSRYVRVLFPFTEVSSFLMTATLCVTWMSGAGRKGRPGQLVVNASMGVSQGGIRKTPKSSTPKTLTPGSRLAAGYRVLRYADHAPAPHFTISLSPPLLSHTHSHMQL